MNFKLRLPIHFMEKTKDQLLKQPINICGGWCSICQLFLNDVCNCVEDKTEHVVRCIIKRCAKNKNTTCFECKEFPCAIIKKIQTSHPNNAKFYVRHMWIDNVNYLKKYGEKEYKKRLLADKNMRTNPYETGPRKSCPCKYCKKSLKINLKKG